MRINNTYFCNFRYIFVIFSYIFLQLYSDLFVHFKYFPRVFYVYFCVYFMYFLCIFVYISCIFCVFLWIFYVFFVYFCGYFMYFLCIFHVFSCIMTGNFIIRIIVVQYNIKNNNQ